MIKNVKFGNGEVVNDKENNIPSLVCKIKDGNKYRRSVLSIDISNEIIEKEDGIGAFTSPVASIICPDMKESFVLNIRDIAFILDTALNVCSLTDYIKSIVTAEDETTGNEIRFYITTEVIGLLVPEEWIKITIKTDKSRTVLLFDEDEIESTLSILDSAIKYL